jgi:hypothetical protein
MEKRKNGCNTSRRLASRPILAGLRNKISIISNIVLSKKPLFFQVPLVAWG